MRIVAIAAGHQSLINAVVFGLGEIGFNALMTAVTQRRLGGHQQIMCHLGSMDGVTRGASYIVSQVFRLHEILMTFALLVAVQAALTRLLCAQFVEQDDLGDVSAPIHVRFTWSVAAFASLPLRTFMLSSLGAPVRSAVIALGLSLVTSLARVCAYIQRRIRWLMGRACILAGLVGQQRMRK